MWWQQATKQLNTSAKQQALDHQAQLTKPQGALGRLENIAVDFAAWQGTYLPKLENIAICIFASDHGVVDEAVSAYPQSVTAQMIENFSRGGAAISVLANKLNADFSVINLGAVTELPPLARVQNSRIAPGTLNFCHAAAMDQAQLQAALLTGKQQVAAVNHLFIGGEMGIGNTTSSAALVSALLGCDVSKSVGPGTGLNQKQQQHKQQVVQRALDLHATELTSPMAILRCLGGFEIVALVGAYIAAAQRGVPILVDGYISSCAALFACAINEDVKHWLLFSHQSAEPGHQLILNELKAKPLLDFNLRLGEASGAALVVPLLQSACLLHSDMHTFAQAGVSVAKGDADANA